AVAPTPPAQAPTPVPAVSVSPPTAPATVYGPTSPMVTPPAAPSAAPPATATASVAPGDSLGNSPTVGGDPGSALSSGGSLSNTRDPISPSAANLAGTLSSTSGDLPSAA